MTNEAKPLPGAQFIGEVVSIFVVRHNEDTTEGKGKTIVHSYHLTKRSAIITADKLGPMGATDGEVEDTLAIKLLDGSYTLLPKPIKIMPEDTEAEVRIRNQALCRLSAAERAALSGYLLQ